VKSRECEEGAGGQWGEKESGGGELRNGSRKARKAGEISGCCGDGQGMRLKRRSSLSLSLPSNHKRSRFLCRHLAILDVVSILLIRKSGGSPQQKEQKSQGSRTSRKTSKGGPGGWGVEEKEGKQVRE